MANNNSLRIIGGEWRSRRLQFIDSPKIRPTPDRVRETLFNWLADKINGANCLDLFAGSGALGFESVSRGAKHALLIENDAKIVTQLTQQKELFQADSIVIKQQNALQFLQQEQQQFDVIFLDPPYASSLLEQALPLLIEKNFLSSNGLLYIETSSMQAVLPELKNIKMHTRKNSRRSELCTIWPKSLAFLKMHAKLIIFAWAIHIKLCL